MKGAASVPWRIACGLEKADYTLTYKTGCKNVGPHSVVVKFIGKYTGNASQTRSFNILPRGTSLSKVKAKKKAITVKWKKQAVQTTGYQIQYSTSSNFKKGTRTVTVNKTKTVSKKIKKLKAKKKYYIRIRTYKTVSGKKYYSSWSKAKSLKTK